MDSQVSFEVQLGTVGETLPETRKFRTLADAEDFARSVVTHPSQSIESAIVMKVQREELLRVWK